MSPEERLKYVAAIDRSIAKLYDERRKLYGDKCLHERVKEILFKHAPTHNSRYCQLCHYQEFERNEYEQLQNETWRKVSVFRT